MTGAKPSTGSILGYGLLMAIVLLGYVHFLPLAVGGLIQLQTWNADPIWRMLAFFLQFLAAAVAGLVFLWPGLRWKDQQRKERQPQKRQKPLAKLYVFFMIITALPLLIILLQTVSVYYQLPQWMMSVAFWYNRAADYVNNCGFLFAICLCQFLLCRRQKTTSAK